VALVFVANVACPSTCVAGGSDAAVEASSNLRTRLLPASATHRAPELSIANPTGKFRPWIERDAVASLNVG